MQSSRHLVFRSSAFLPEPGEDADTNPGVYGKALANWLASQFRVKGRAIHGCLAEDFGRLVHVAHPRLRLYAACANGRDFSDQWHIFAIAEGGLWSLFASHKKRDAADGLIAEIETILRSEPSITEMVDVHAHGA